MKVMIGLSGGVDSAVAAFLLKQQGYEVIAGFMRNWDAMANHDVLGNPTLANPICPQEEDYNDAKKVAEHLGIPLYRIDFVKEYWDDVFTYFLDEYKKGRTPNPDLFCNKYIKFEAFRSFAIKQGCTHIAMGHYAGKEEKGGHAYLLESKDQGKDQTYFLAQISQEQLKATLFPLTNLLKSEVRSIARENNIPVAEKKDSTGVCFIGERHFREFLKNYIPAQPGPIIDIGTNETIGTHEGVYYYTIGQRKGLGIGGISNRPAGMHFIVQKDVKHNILYVASEHEDSYLLGDMVTVDTLNWINEVPLNGKTYMVKYRYRQKATPAIVASIENGLMTLRLPVAQKAITPGQAAVLYDNHRCLGGGLISRVYYRNKLVNE